MSENRFGSKDTVEYYLVYSALIQAARLRGTVTYQELALLTGLPLTGNHMSRSLGWVLGTISENEVRHHRPMLSALCVTTTGIPGKNFLPFARELGILGSDDPQQEHAFWEDQCQACYEIWQQKFPKK